MSVDGVWNVLAMVWCCHHPMSARHFFSPPYLSVICIHFRTTEFVPSFGRFAVATVPSQPPSLLLRHRLLTSLLLLLPTDSGGGGNSNECCAVAPPTTSTTGNIHFKLEKIKSLFLAVVVLFLARAPFLPGLWTSLVIDRKATTHPSGSR